MEIERSWSDVCVLVFRRGFHFYNLFLKRWFSFLSSPLPTPLPPFISPPASSSRLFSHFFSSPLAPLYPSALLQVVLRPLSLLLVHPSLLPHDFWPPPLNLSPSHPLLLIFSSSSLPHCFHVRQKSYSSI